MNVLTLSNISKKIHRRTILENITLSVDSGEIFGFVGPNGAGKTTTIKIITGLMRPDSGHVLVNGLDVQKDHDKAISNLGAIVESPALYGYLSGLDNLKITAKLRGIKYDELDDIINITGLKERIKDKVRTYSLGMKERLAIGCAMTGKPKLLILDEPTNGLDPLGVANFRELLKKLSVENNTAVFLSSHQLSEIQQICRRVAFINNGKILDIETVDDILKSGKNMEEKFMKLMRRDGNAEKCVLS